MKESELRTLLQKEFGSVVRPDPDHIATGNCAHHCYEEARAAFDQLAGNMSAKNLEEICDHLAFLSPDAFDFVFPKLMVAALDDPEAYLVAMTVFNRLVDTPEYMTRHFSHYSLEQRRALYAYLKFIIDEYGPPMITQRHLDSRLAFWDKFTVW